MLLHEYVAFQCRCRTLYLSLPLKLFKTDLQTALSNFAHLSDLQVEIHFTIVIKLQDTFIYKIDEMLF